MTCKRVFAGPEQLQERCPGDQVVVRRFTAEQVRSAPPELTRSGFVTCDAHDAVVAVLRSRIAQLLEAPR